MAGAADSSGAAASVERTDGSRDDGVRAGMVIAGRYALERPIGTGGMATIWEGTHLALNRPIAIKFIDFVGPNSAKMRGRFLREARVAAAVQHRNVVDIVDFGTTEDGKPFMVMELLVGRTLADRMTDPTPIAVGEAVRIVARVLSGLAAVHDAGIVHRDLKPENVILVKDADGTYPKLIDFGVSRAVDPRGDLKSVLPTVENAIVGTPQYMSPEQARGLTGLDSRADLWSVGVLLYELLTGQLPYDSDAVGDIIIQIATAEPPEFASLRPDLAGPLERVIKKAMARKPEDRYQTAREMRQDLLSAVARTAAEIEGIVGRRSQVRSETRSDLPPVGARELLDAVGDAYEPGDSGLIDFSEHVGALVDWGDTPEPSSGLRAVPPAARRGAPDPFDAPRVSTDASTLDPGLEEVAPRRSRGWIVAVAAVALLGLGGAGGWLALRPVDDGIRATELAEGGERAAPAEPSATDVAPPSEEAEPAGEGAVAAAEAPAPAEVSVTLEGVPEGAEVRVDGAPVEGPIALPRDDEAHRVEVVAADGRTWSTSHVASDDGAYRVELPPRARRRRRGSRRTARSPRSGGSGLLRDPGF